jgi:DNA-binding response OmpR family regulator
MGKTVLLVEDDFFIRDLYRIALEKKGNKVVTAVTGQEAIEAFNTMQPDIVLLDIMLPDFNGIEVLKFIREKTDGTGKTPVIMVTNLDTPESMNQALLLGANDYWIKSTKDPMTVAEEVNHYYLGQAEGVTE